MKSIKSKPIVIDFETWCRLCDELGVTPETPINDVIERIKQKKELLIKYRMNSYNK